MRKFTFIFILYVIAFFMFLNTHQNTILVAMQDVKPYTTEIEFIVNDYNSNIDIVHKNIEGYINRVKNIESGFLNLEKPYILKKYFEYKITSFENLEKALTDIKKNKNTKEVNTYINNYNKYTRLSEIEIKKVFKNALLKQ